MEIIANMVTQKFKYASICALLTIKMLKEQYIYYSWYFGGIPAMKLSKDRTVTWRNKRTIGTALIQINFMGLKLVVDV